MHPFSAFDMLTTNAITVRDAKRKAEFSLIARSAASSRMTGLNRLMNWSDGSIGLYAYQANPELIDRACLSQVSWAGVLA